MHGDEWLATFIRDVPDWPTAGVVFKDITPLLADPAAFAATIDRLSGPFVGRGITKVVGIEARGFVIASPVAHRLGAGFIPARKPGKLPWGTESQAYELEYGSDQLEIHTDAAHRGVLHGAHDGGWGVVPEGGEPLTDQQLRDMYTQTPAGPAQTSSAARLTVRSPRIRSRAPRDPRGPEARARHHLARDDELPRGGRPCAREASRATRRRGRILDFGFWILD